MVKGAESQWYQFRHLGKRLGEGGLKRVLHLEIILHLVLTKTNKKMRT